MEMEEELSVWIEKLKQGDPRTQQEIWDAYFQKLVTMTRHKLRGSRLRSYDEEDVALSSFNSLFRAIEEDRVPKLDDPTDLWKLLAVITARKVSAQRRRDHTIKRGSGQVRGESVFLAPGQTVNAGLEQALGSEPSPEMAMMAAETIGELMRRLPEENLRQIALLKFEGHSNREIAEKLDCVERTISRKIERIRAVWQCETGG